MTGRPRRPPKRTCGVCGGDYYGWAERGACPRCFAETAAEGAELAGLVREGRQLRLGFESDVPAEPVRRVVDDIPY